MNEITDRRNTTRAEIDIYASQNKNEYREFTRISERSTSLMIEVYDVLVIIYDCDTCFTITFDVDLDDDKSFDDLCESIAIKYNSLISEFKIN
jgi:hypothetical protein